MKDLQRVKGLSIMGSTSAFQIPPFLKLNDMTQSSYVP